MIDLIKPLLIPFLWILLVLVIWFSGDFHGRGVIEAKWNAQKIQDKANLEKERELYAKQITDANDERDENRALLDRIRSAPKPRILCYRANVPTSHNIGADNPPSSGELPQGTGYDISPDLYKEADRADTLVEQFRDYQNRVPQAHPDH
jgi:hypothetical protein